MSSNKVNFDNSQNQAKQKCLDVVDENMFNLHTLTKGNDDKCYLDYQVAQSVGPGNYKLYNNYHCEEQAAKVDEIADKNPYIFLKKGLDIPRNNIDDSTVLRIGETMAEPRCPQQLFHRPYKTVPYKGRGIPSNDLESFVNNVQENKDKSNNYFEDESKLIHGELTHARRECNVLSGVTIPHFFTPLVPHLKDNVQNPEHLVEEVAEDGWVRGGTPSRLLIRDIDYLQRCGYAYTDKTMNGEFWENDV